MRLSDTAVGLDHWLPVLFLDEEQSVPYPPTDWVADGEVAVGLVDSSEESVGGTGRIGPHQDRMDDLVGKVSDIVTGLVLSRQSTERLVEQLEVVVGVIRPGVPRAQHGSRGSPVVSHHTPRGWNPNHVCSLHLANWVHRVVFVGHRIGVWPVVARPATCGKVGMPMWTLVERAAI